MMGCLVHGLKYWVKANNGTNDEVCFACEIETAAPDRETRANCTHTSRGLFNDGFGFMRCNYCKKQVAHDLLASERKRLESLKEINHSIETMFYEARRAMKFDALKTTIKQDPSRKFLEKPKCKHKWAKYIGFTETYCYCTMCDEKRQ